MVCCLFCAVPCPTNFVVVDGTVTRVKTEIITADDNHASGGDAELLSFEEEPPIIEEHLKAIFILREVLGVGKEKISQFLGEGDGLSYLEFWVNLCNSCGEEVNQCFKAIKEISKLERRLKAAKAELKGKIVGSKNSQDSSAIWNNIREEILLNEESSDDSQPVPDSAETKIVDVGSASDDRNEESNPDPIPREINEPSESINVPPPQPPLVSAVVDVPTSSTPPRKTRKWSYSCSKCPYNTDLRFYYERHLLLHSEGSESFPCPYCGWFVLPKLYSNHCGLRHKNIPNPAKPTPPLRPEHPILSSSTIKNLFTPTVRESPLPLLICELCPYRNSSERSVNRHLNTHDKGSIPCEDCGIHFLPSNIARHKARYHNPHSQSNPKALTDTRKIRYFKCNLCPYESYKSTRLLNHSKVHEEGSRATACGVCSVLVFPENMLKHRGTIHRIAKPPDAPPAKQYRKYYQCPECNALLGTLTEYREHETLHENGSLGKCVKCGWMVKNMSGHAGRWHPATGKVRKKFEREIKLMPKRKT